MITAHALTTRYGDTTTVDEFAFDVRPAVVTGFVGPNGSGRSTTTRMIMGLDVPDSGSALIGDRSYAELAWPLREVRALLDAKAFLPGLPAVTCAGWPSRTTSRSAGWTRSSTR